MRKHRFDYSLDFARTDFRQKPWLYRPGVGEQGVLLVEPYKSELLPHWRFARVTAARKSAAQIYAMFLGHLDAKDFVGADMARKYLQMGFTRARRFANHRSKRKYAATANGHKTRRERGNSRHVLRQDANALTNEKARAAAIFKRYWDRARRNGRYVKLRSTFGRRCNCRPNRRRADRAGAN